MKIRYSISEKWTSDSIHRVIAALEWVIAYYNIEDVSATLMAKLITGNDEPCEATADRIKNKRFEIRLNRLLLKTDEELTKAIMHEMTHVKQFMVNGLRLKGKTARWNNSEYSFETSDDYYFSPWEMEARAMEEPLYHKFEEVY